MSRPTKLFYDLKRGKKGPQMVLKNTKKPIEKPTGLSSKSLLKGPFIFIFIFIE